MGGGLAPLDSLPVEAVPRAFAIDPSGQLVIVAGLDCNSLGVYAVSEAGTLSKLDASKLIDQLKACESPVAQTA